MFEKVMEFLGYLKAEKDEKTGEIRVGDHVYDETGRSRVAHMTSKEILERSVEAVKKYGLIRT